MQPETEVQRQHTYGDAGAHAIGLRLLRVGHAKGHDVERVACGRRQYTGGWAASDGRLVPSAGVYGVPREPLKEKTTGYVGRVAKSGSAQGGTSGVGSVRVRAPLAGSRDTRGHERTEFVGEAELLRADAQGVQQHVAAVVHDLGPATPRASAR